MKDIIVEWESITHEFYPTWGTLSLDEQLDLMFKQFGKIIFRIFYLRVENLRILWNNSRVMGKAIKRWCDENPELDLAENIVAQYFSDGKSLGKFIYYSVVINQDGSVKIYRDLEKSPRPEKTQKIS